MIKPQLQQHLEVERKAVVRHLEKLIEREKGHEISLREQLQEDIHRVKIKYQGIRQKIDVHEQNIVQQEIEKKRIEDETKVWEKKLKEVQDQKFRSITERNAQITQMQKLKQEVEKQHQSDLVNAQAEHFNELRKLDLQWSQRCEELIQNTRRIDEQNDDLIRKIGDIKNDMTTYGYECQNKNFELIEKIRRTMIQENKERLSQLESNLDSLDQLRLEYNRKYSEDVAKQQKELRQNTDDFDAITREKIRFILENDDAKMGNQQFENFVACFQKDLKDKEHLYNFLRLELDQLKIKSEKVNEEDRHQLSQVQNVHKNDGIKSDNETNELKLRSDGLLKSIQDSEAENKRLFNDINRITELLQANASKAIYETLQKRNVI